MGQNLRYNIGIFSICILVLFFIYSFAQADDVKPVSKPANKTSSLVERKIQEKLEKFEKTILDRCRQEAIDDAEIFVDSLVSEEIKLHGGDTLYFPSKPTRPGLPEKITLNDSTAIIPILK